MVSAETLAVSAVAALPGLLLGYLLGWIVLAAVRSSGLIAGSRPTRRARRYRWPVSSSSCSRASRPPR
ncbi:hypothetical protein [Amycolatopsis methanolica]|uniref:hypothetical protein n=1 Tax=Amycolatopsis methanolica TaxID=1814 RepID=UPI00039C3E16|nr:hypothetical protein [Amycolatopsis methanolica]